MDADNVHHQEVGGLSGGWELGECNEMGLLGETVYDGKYHAVTLRHWKTYHKIQGDV